MNPYVKIAIKSLAAAYAAAAGYMAAYGHSDLYMVAFVAVGGALTYAAGALDPAPSPLQKGAA